MKKHIQSSDSKNRKAEKLDVTYAHAQLSENMGYKPLKEIQAAAGTAGQCRRRVKGGRIVPLLPCHPARVTGAPGFPVDASHQTTSPAGPPAGEGVVTSPMIMWVSVGVETGGASRVCVCVWWMTPNDQAGHLLSFWSKRPV